VGPERFVEIHVNTSLERRKSLDARGAYGPSHVKPSEEAPHQPDAVVSLDKQDPEEVAYELVKVLEKRGLLPSTYAL
jgi:adenylylsulfate kinase-like enzyme